MSTKRLTPLRIQLLARHKSNRWLASQTGISESKVSRLVNGKATLTDEERERIGLALGLQDEERNSL